MSDEVVQEIMPVVHVAEPIELMERAQIDSQIATAKKYPRSLAAVKKRMMLQMVLKTRRRILLKPIWKARVRWEPVRNRML